MGLNLLGLHPTLLLLIAGSFVMLRNQIGRTTNRASAVRLAPLLASRALAPEPRSIAKTAAAAALTAAPFTLGTLFLVFFKVGALIFGSGYVLLAFLRSDLVVQRAWLTDAKLADAIAVGQVTPGPVFTTATFIGYLLGGAKGAVIATVAIFIPAFLLVAASGPLVPRVRQSQVAGAFLDGVNVASLALMVVVSWQLGRASITDITTAALAILSLVALLRFRLNSGWVVLAGAAVGLLAQTLRSL